MTIAERKKQTNIAEYIIHMYQSEDLIRAFECDMEKIEEYVLKHIPENSQSKNELTQWYSNLLDRMNKENILDKGHLKELHDIVFKLEELKDSLINSDAEFAIIYNDASASINEMLSLAEGKIKSEIQICLNGIYGLLIAKINGREVPDDFKNSIEHFGNVLSYLSYKYNQKDYLTNN